MAKNCTSLALEAIRAQHQTDTNVEDDMSEMFSAIVNIASGIVKEEEKLKESPQPSREQFSSNLLGVGSNADRGRGPTPVNRTAVRDTLRLGERKSSHGSLPYYRLEVEDCRLSPWSLEKEDVPLAYLEQPHVQQKLGKIARLLIQRRRARENRLSASQ